jgi:hypothetical protein
MFDAIPVLVFDPFDKQAREAWMKTVTKERKQEVLGRLFARLYTDADMPPVDAPEHDLFRIKGAAAFAELKGFLEAEVEKPKKP